MFNAWYRSPTSLLAEASFPWHKSSSRGQTVLVPPLNKYLLSAVICCTNVNMCHQVSARLEVLHVTHRG